ncbi:MAG TPA: transglutaminaseTgpA domain-containing protein [Caldilineaceae bacterium]|nr:transglutaminaseTgpA domain-containing protein [Caldilineaceae bacterium]
MTTLTSTSATPVSTPLPAAPSPSRARNRYAENIYFQDGVVLTGVLTSLLYLILATSMDAAGYVESMALLVPVTLGALALGFLMAFSRFDGFFALSHSMFTGLAWILFLMSGLVSEQEITPFVNNGIPELQAKAYFVLLRWLNWIDAAINDVASNDNYIFIFEICFLVWWLTYLGVWSIFRHGYTWRAIIPTGIVLLINTYYAPQSILGFLVVFCLVAMLLFVRTNLAEQQLRWREQRIHFSQDVTFDFLRNGLAYSVAVVALAWLLPGFGRSLEVRAVMAPLNEQWEETTERMNRLYQGLNRQTRPTAATFGRTLTLGGARNVGSGLVFRAQAASARYWRAVVYDTYTGREWLNTGEEEETFRANEVTPVGAWQLRQPMTQTITLLAPVGNLIFAAPDIVQVSVPIVASVRPVPVVGLAGEAAYEITMARSRQALEANESYQVVSYQTMITERALREAGADYPDAIREQYLQLPDDFSERVAADAAAITAEYETPFDKARALETYLRSFTYNEEISAPPPDQDPVEYFLYEIREGYCDYYATAMVVMLRSLGIPARLVSGYAEGSYDPEMAVFTITEQDAHTWVEVFFPGYGWIEFEPTAGESQLNRPSGLDSALNDTMDGAMEPSSGGAIPQNPYEDEMMYPGMETVMDQPLTETGGALGSWSWWLWAALTPLVLVVGGWFIWRTRVAGPTRFDPDVPPILFERLQRWAARLGLGVEPHQTPYEQARHFGRHLPEGQAPIQTITEGYVRYRFGRRSHLAAPAGVAQTTIEPETDGLIMSWQSLEPVLWRAWFSKLAGVGLRAKKNPFSLIKKQ